MSPWVRHCWGSSKSGLQICPVVASGRERAQAENERKRKKSKRVLLAPEDVKKSQEKHKSDSPTNHKSRKVEECE